MSTVKKPVSSSAKAGLVFPVGRLHRYLKGQVMTYSPEDGSADKTVRVSVTAAVFMAAVLQVLTADLLELSGNKAKDSKK